MPAVEPNVTSAVVPVVLAGVSAGAASWAVVSVSGRRRGRARVRSSVRAGAGTRAAIAATASLLQRMAPGLLARAGRSDTQGLIARAGLAGIIGTREVAAARLVCVAIAGLLVPRVLGALPPRMWPLAIGAWIAGAGGLPSWWLGRAGRRREAAIRDALPDALDLLRACLAAGLPLRRALLLVSRHCRDPLAPELACVATECALGVPQMQALGTLATRIPMPEIRALVSAITRAERHGSRLAPEIAALAAEARGDCNRAIVERGARAAPKIQLVVAATFVPAAMLGLIAVALAAIARGDLRFM